jgi:hypothetical protein
LSSILAGSAFVFRSLFLWIIDPILKVRMICASCSTPSLVGLATMPAIEGALASPRAQKVEGVANQRSGSKWIKTPSLRAPNIVIRSLDSCLLSFRCLLTQVAIITESADVEPSWVYRYVFSQTGVKLISSIPQHCEHLAEVEGAN